jgi:hypothetical protein
MIQTCMTMPAAFVAPTSALETASTAALGTAGTHGFAPMNAPINVIVDARVRDAKQAAPPRGELH